MTRLDPGYVGRIEQLLGARPVSAVRCAGGYSRAERLRLRLTDGRSVFVKRATTPATAEFLRCERHVYEALGPQPFLPGYLAFDDGDDPLLVLEDLAANDWPPPWTDRRIAAVLDALAAVRHSPHPAELGRLEDDRAELARWGAVAAEPEPFLALGLCTAAWLGTALPVLLSAEAEMDLAGDDLIHLDVRSDNLCFTADGRAILIDWNWAVVGNGDLDIAAWLPSLHAEGGPRPEEILPGNAPFAAMLAGYFASVAGQPATPDAPTVRAVQLSQLEVALPWAARACGLREPVGRE